VLRNWNISRKREKFEFAKIRGSEMRDGQMVQQDFVLRDGDVIEFHI
jgi:ribosome-interacting GTPase 1